MPLVPVRGIIVLDDFPVARMFSGATETISFSYLHLASLHPRSSKDEPCTPTENLLSSDILFIGSNQLGAQHFCTHRLGR